MVNDEHMDAEATRPYTLAEYILDVHKAREEHPQWRAGQAYFNVLAGSPKGLLTLRAPDPFYVDDHISGFLAYMVQHWDDTGLE